MRRRKLGLIILTLAVFETVFVLLVISKPSENFEPYFYWITESAAQLYNTTVSQNLSTETSEPTNLGITLQHLPSVQPDFECLMSRCWAGIYPGLTTVSEAQRLLELRYGIEAVTVEAHAIRWTTTHQIDISQFGSIGIHEGIATTVYINFPKDHLTIDKFITQLGEPSFSYVVQAFSSELHCAGAGIVYQDKGIDAYLSPESVLESFNPTISVHSLELMPIEWTMEWDMTDTAILEWDGYKDYCTLAVEQGKLHQR